jgi:hypothetical protein
VASALESTSDDRTMLPLECGEHRERGVDRQSLGVTGEDPRGHQPGDQLAGPITEASTEEVGDGLVFVTIRRTDQHFT